MPFDPNAQEEQPDINIVRRKSKAVIDPEFIESHPVKDRYMEVSVRTGKIIRKARLGTEEQRVMVQPLGEIKKDGVDLVLDTEVPDSELPEGEYYVKDRHGRIFKIIIYDTYFQTDLKELVKGQFFGCPAQVFPTINDRIVQTARNEIKAKFPEKRKEEKNMYWLLLIPVAIMAIIIGLSFIGR